MLAVSGLKPTADYGGAIEQRYLETLFFSPETDGNLCTYTQIQA